MSERRLAQCPKNPQLEGPGRWTHLWVAGDKPSSLKCAYCGAHDYELDALEGAARTLLKAGLYARVSFRPMGLRGGTRYSGDGGAQGMVYTMEGGYHVEVEPEGYLVRLAPMGPEDGQLAKEARFTSLLEAVEYVIQNRGAK
jgi:hypothetical protein